MDHTNQHLSNGSDAEYYVLRQEGETLICLRHSPRHNLFSLEVLSLTCIDVLELEASSEEPWWLDWEEVGKQL